MKKPDWTDKPLWDQISPEDLKLGQPNVPYVTTLSEIEVMTKTGSITKLPNPLWKFRVPLNAEKGESTVYEDYGVNYSPGRDV